MECISAIATANGTGGVAIIRISGEKALDIAGAMFSPMPKEVEPNRMYAGHISGDGFADYGFMVFFAAPRSFTGENTVEIHCHGGVHIARGILKKTILLGARPAERGEFTRRAFLNGKLSLASAEGMADMINAESSALLRAGSMLYSERLTREVGEIQNKLKYILASVDAEIDYPEEDEGDIDLQKIQRELREVLKSVNALSKGYSCGKMIKNGVTVAICGKPNAGKSSLLNALLGYDRAIVSPEAGTTRDVLEGAIELNGVKFNLIDTAGIRAGATGAESEGIARARAAVRSADVTLFVTEGGEEPPKEYGGKLITVFNKCDISAPERGYDAVISALTGEGIEELKRLLVEAAGGEQALDKAYLVEERHYLALMRAQGALSDACATAQKTADLLAVDIKEAWDALGEITGETASEEVIAEIFSKFCVGK